MQKHLFLATIMSLLVLLASCSGASDNKESLNTESTDGGETLLEYRFEIKMEDSLRPAGHLKLYISENAIRSEMKMNFFGQQNRSMIMLATADKPEETILLDPENKTFSKFDVQLPLEVKNGIAEMTKDSMVIVGKRIAGGYQCTQVNIITTVDIPVSMAGINEENGRVATIKKYWLSKEIPGYEKMSKMLQSRPQMMNGMDAEVYKYGMPVRQVIFESGAINFVMELEKAEQKEISDRMFVIPDDYTDRKKSDH